MEEATLQVAGTGKDRGATRVEGAGDEQGTAPGELTSKEDDRGDEREAEEVEENGGTETD